MRLALQEGQAPRHLQENGNSRPTPPGTSHALFADMRIAKSRSSLTHPRPKGGVAQSIAIATPPLVPALMERPPLANAWVSLWLECVEG